MTDVDVSDSRIKAPNVSVPSLFRVFFFIGATSFGGGGVAYMREHLVSHLNWMDDDHFLGSLEIGQTVPGLVSTDIAAPRFWTEF
jgi:chromate transporter